MKKRVPFSVTGDARVPAPPTHMHMHTGAAQCKTNCGRGILVADWLYIALYFVYWHRITPNNQLPPSSSTQPLPTDTTASNTYTHTPPLTNTMATLAASATAPLTVLHCDMHSDVRDTAVKLAREALASAAAAATPSSAAAAAPAGGGKGSAAGAAGGAGGGGAGGAGAGGGAGAIIAGGASGGFEKDAAALVKKGMESACGGCWHVVMGASFGASISHDNNAAVLFKLGKMAVLAFQTFEDSSLVLAKSAAGRPAPGRREGKKGEDEEEEG